MSDAPHPVRKLYGRRKGPKLSAHQQHLLEELLPRYALNIQPGADPRHYFPSWPGSEAQAERDPAIHRIEDVWLEIGFGGGEHLHWQAQQHPHVGLLGAEPYLNGVAKLLSKLEATPLLNIRIHLGDAREIIAALPDASLGRVFILFPDPWPKTRHHKRRFIQMEMLDQLARVMKPGAELRFASDDAGYVEWTLERLMAHPSFEWSASRATDWQTRPDDWTQTRYEAKELHGKPAFLKFARVGRTRNPRQLDRLS